MTTAVFSKYHGLGNDFIIIDKRDQRIQMNENQRRVICSQRFGIGADGLMIIEKSDTLDIAFIYYKANGKLGQLCGNGTRCMLEFARRNNIITGNNPVRFQTADGEYKGSFDVLTKQPFFILNDIETVTKYDDRNFYIFNGSANHVRFVDDVDSIDVISESRKPWYSHRYEAAGVNVCFVQRTDDGHICQRTYERGVEDETFACGTGAVATAVATWIQDNKPGGNRKFDDISRVIYFHDGQLFVSFNYMNGIFTKIILKGDATHVFNGEYFIPVDEE